MQGQISLGIRPVWSESSLSAWSFGSLAVHWEHNIDSDRTGWKPWLIWVLTGRICHLLVLSCCDSLHQDVFKRLVWHKKPVFPLTCRKNLGSRGRSDWTRHLGSRLFHFHGEFEENVGKMVKSTPPPPQHIWIVSPKVLDLPLGRECCNSLVLKTTFLR